MDKKYSLWFRVGCTFNFTKEEVKTLLNADTNSHTLVKLIVEKLKAVEFSPDGETYLPAEQIEDFLLENPEFENEIENVEYGDIWLDL